MLDVLLSNNFLSAVLAFGAVLIPVVIIHELGHFLAAKAVGITVLEFGIGFPPRMVKLFQWGETDFTLNWLMLGGFVRPLGDDFVRPLGEEEIEKDRQELAAKRKTLAEDYPQDEREALKARGIENIKSVNDVKPLPRIFFMLAGALANFITAFIMFTVVGLTGVPQLVGAQIEVLQVLPDSLFANVTLNPQDRIQEINGEIFADSFAFFSRLQTLNGQNVVLTVYNPETRETFSVNFVPNLTEDNPILQGHVRVMAVALDSPAHLAGLLADDLILNFNDVAVTESQDPTALLQQLTDQNVGQQVTLTVLRHGEQIAIHLTPRANPPQGEGKIGIEIASGIHALRDGVTYTSRGLVKTSPLGLSDSVQYGFSEMTRILTLIIDVPRKLFQGAISAEEARPVSFIGISQVGGEVFQQSRQQGTSTPILNYFAIISIALGFTNLLPIPALDGGRILFVLLEIVRGRPISPEREGVVHLIGLIFILSVGVLVMLNDIINPLRIIP